ncbi:MAG: hypothetical protein Q9204_003504 [Flavoplaca sp. TL-2023a]
MRPKRIYANVPLALRTCLPFTVATPRVADTLLLPLRIPQQQCHNFASQDLTIPPSVPKPATKCSWKDILECGTQTINCGQICVETVQRVPSNPPLPSPQCHACLSASTISHCANCFGTRVPTGFTPQTYVNAPSITRKALCSAAKVMPEANCIVEGFCTDEDLPTPREEGEEEEGNADPLARVNEIIAELGPDAVGDVDVQGDEATGGDGGAARVTTGADAGSTTGENTGGRAAGLCGKYFCT